MVSLARRYFERYFVFFDGIFLVLFKFYILEYIKIFTIEDWHKV